MIENEDEDVFTDQSDLSLISRIYKRNKFYRINSTPDPSSGLDFLTTFRPNFVKFFSQIFKKFSEFLNRVSNKF